MPLVINAFGGVHIDMHMYDIMTKSILRNQALAEAGWFKKLFKPKFLL